MACGLIPSIRRSVHQPVRAFGIALRLARGGVGGTTNTGSSACPAFGDRLVALLKLLELAPGLIILGHAAAFLHFAHYLVPPPSGHVQILAGQLAPLFKQLSLKLLPFPR